MEHFNLIKSFTTLVNNITSLPSREGLGLGLGKVRMGLRMLILCLSLAVLGVESVWGTNSYYAKGVADLNSNSPSGAAKVYSVTPNDAQETGTSGGDVEVTFKAEANAGYSFKGWTDTESKTTIISGSNKTSWTTKIKAATKKNETKTTTYYAYFTANTYKVVFNKNNEQASGSMAEQSFTYGTAQNLTANAFSQTYTVSFDVNGGTPAPEQKSSSRPFNGWATSADGAVSYANQQNVNKLTTTDNGTVTLYAKWGDQPAIKLPSASKTGSVLEGWFDGDAKVGEAGQDYIPTKTVSLQAHWVNQYDFDMACAINNELKVGDIKSDVFNFIHADNPNFTIEDPAIISYNAATNTVTALQAGTTTITFNQSATTTIKSGSKQFSFTVTKIANTLAVDATHTMKVDETWTSVISGKNSDATITTTTSDKTIAYYDVANNKIVAQNTNNQSFISKEVTITISQAATYKYTAVEKTITVTVNKHVPTFTWSNATLYHNQIYNDFFTTNCPNALSVKSSSDDGVAYLVDGTNAQKLNLKTLTKAASTTLTVTQAENYYWAEHTESKTITPNVAPNHVPFTYNEAMFNDGNITITKAGTSNIYMVDNGRYVQLGENATTISGGDAWKEKYIVIKFNGIPDKVSFEYATSSGASTSPDFKVYESSNGTNFNEIFSDNRSSSSWSSTITKDLSKDTRYLKFFFDGNYGGQYQHITVTELKTFSVNKTELDFGSNKKDIACANQTFTFNYANVGHKVVLETSDPHFSVSPTSITNIGGEKYGTQTITVSYRTDEVHSATNAKLTIKDELGNSKEVTLKGSTTKKAQALKWEKPYDVEEPAIPIGKKITGAATASSNLGVIYESSDETIIEIVDDGKAFKAIKEGSATITAKQVGTDDWEETSISKSFKGTNKIIQVISWNQNFTRLLTNYGTQSLTAIVNLENAETGEQAYSKERSDLIIYTSQNTSVVSVSGSTLTIVGKGETTLTATIPGDDLYESATVTIPVKVREPSAGCEDEMLGNDFGSGEYEFFHYSLTSDMEKVVKIDRTTSAIPGVLSFQHKGKKWGLSYSGEIVVYESTNNGQSWTKLGEITPTVDKYNTQPYPLSRNATHIKFFRGKSAKGYHYIKNVEISPAQFIESNAVDNTIDFGNVTVNSMEERPVTLSYANVKDNLTITKSSDDLTLSCGDIIDLDCGATGTNTFTISFIPTALGDFSDAIQFNDKNSKKNYTLNVKAKVVKSAQYIIWNPATTDLLTTDNVQFDANTSASEMGLSVTYSIPEEQQSIATIDASTGQLTIYTAGEISVTVSQEGSDLISPAVPVSKTFTITREIPDITTSPVATTSIRPTTLADLTLQGGEASQPGIFVWTDPTTTLKLGEHPYSVTFIPTNAVTYGENIFNINIVLDNQQQYISWDIEDKDYYCGEIISLASARSKATANDAATGLQVVFTVDDETLASIDGSELTTLKTGTPKITIGQPGNLTYLPATDVSKTIIIQPNVFTGEGGDDDWNNPANWKAGVPTDETPDASVKGDLTIQSDHKVNIFTIESGASVTIKNGATLTIKGSSAGRETYGDIIVENGGKLVIEETADSVCVQNVYLATSFGEHSSSQVIAAEHLSVHGDAFFDITLADDANPNKWHAFTVPFPVDARKGIYDLDGNPLTNEVHYAIMSYHGDVRAQGKYGWAKFRNIMTPGTFYLMTVDGTIPTFRFRKTTEGNMAATNLLQVAQFPKSSDAQITDAGWNGIGNSQLSYVSVDAPVQVLDPVSYTYELMEASSTNFTVGTPFFYQASADGSVVLDAANGSNPAYAPARVGAAEVKNVDVTLSNNCYTDHLYLSATDEATAEYQIGRDLVKMTMTSTPSVPQIFALAYNTALCMVDAPMTNDEAQVSVRLYAPANGEYTLSVSNDAAADVYLLHNGMPVWNLSESAYTLDLEKGNTEGYSLRLRRAHKQTTDIDVVNGSDESGVQKVIMDNQLYILRGGQIYTVTGQIR